MNRADKLAMFYKEINSIADDNLRKLATEVIACADDYFFTIPASSTGRNHPPFSLGEGGLVRHTAVNQFLWRRLCTSRVLWDFIHTQKLLNCKYIKLWRNLLEH